MTPPLWQSIALSVSVRDLHEGISVVLEDLMHYRFRILDEAGNDLGPFATRRDEWATGDRLARWHGEALEIVSVVEAEPGDAVNGYLVVRRIS